MLSFIDNLYSNGPLPVHILTFGDRDTPKKKKRTPGKLLRHYYLYRGITLTVASCCFRRLLEMKNNIFASFYLNAIIVA